MKLLLTNDDGIEAPGLAALQRASESLGEQLIMAPDSAHSGCSHRTTTDRPLSAVPLGHRRYAVDGSPADCVRLGLLSVQPEIDWVLSGINEGGNLGVDIFMSGTVAAAREATLLGYPAIAISQYRRGPHEIDWDRSARLALRVLKLLRHEAVDESGYWNVNLPDLADDAPEPEIVRCDPDPHPLPFRFELAEDAYHYRGDYHGRKREPQGDVDVCFSGQIAVSFVPLRAV